jgi:hypothetical protein
MSENRIINDFTPETLSLINRLVAAGFVIHSGSNGEERFNFDGDTTKFLDNLLACDEGWLYVVAPGTPFTPSNKGTGNLIQRRHSLYLVLGNSPGELVCDHSEHPLLDEVTRAHYAEWDGKPQLTTTEAEKYGVRRPQQCMGHLFVENLNDA